MLYRRNIIQNRFVVFRYALFTPVIYAQIIPLVILDIFMEIHHRLCFPLYGIPYVKRGEYIVIDRQKLSYLSPLKKVNCFFCGYANGLLQYCVRIVGDTERFWCGIMHAEREGFRPPPHHANFLPYGDEKAYRDFTGDKL